MSVSSCCLLVAFLTFQMEAELSEDSRHKQISNSNKNPAQHYRKKNVVLHRIQNTQFPVIKKRRAWDSTTIRMIYFLGNEFR